MTVKATEFVLKPNTFEKTPQRVLSYKGHLYSNFDSPKESHVLMNIMTLGRRKKMPKPLNQEKILFHDEENYQISNKKTMTLGRSRKEFSHSEDKTFDASYTIKEVPDSNNWTNTLRKSIRRATSTILNKTKDPETISECWEKAKKYFKNTEYKKAKKEFEKIDISKKSDVCLYLSAIYLLELENGRSQCLIEKNGSKFEKYLHEMKNPFLKLLMGQHADHLRKNEKFLKYTHYDVESFSEDEKIVASALLEKNTSA